MADARVLIVDDDDLLRTILVERLERLGWEVASAGTLAEARRRAAEHAPDVALLDIKLPDGEGTELLTELGAENDVPCVMMTAHATVESAVRALRLGAVDYLEKPFSSDRLDATLARTMELTALRREVRAHRERGGLPAGFVGESPAMQEVVRLVERVAPAETMTVLIQGETGTGKGVVARLVHKLSRRSGGPFVAVTCSSLAETLMESELFGHEKGAFTDARSMKRGLVELADGGTLFLDEIGELSLRLQAKLLQFIEERSFRRVGGTRDLSVDARVVAATNRDLEAEAGAGAFREDLYYRLSAFPLRIPPLRERRSDVAPLARHFVAGFNRELGGSVRRIDGEALALLERHPWPGNVRELRNVIERTVLLADGPVLEAAMLPPELRAAGAAAPEVPEVVLGAGGVDLERLERQLVEAALRQAEGNRTEAGRLLGLSRHQVRNRLRKHGLEEAL